MSALFPCLPSSSKWRAQQQKQLPSATTPPPPPVLTTEDNEDNDAYADEGLSVTIGSGPDGDTDTLMIGNDDGQDDFNLDDDDHGDEERFEVLTAGYRQLFGKIKRASDVKLETLDRLQREVCLWKDSYLDVAREKDHFKSQISALQRQAKRSASMAIQLPKQQRSGTPPSVETQMHRPPTPAMSSSSAGPVKSSGANGHDAAAPSGGDKMKDVSSKGGFAALVLDADALIFSETLLKQGKCGGNKAADLLITAIRELALAMLPEQAADRPTLCMGYIVVPEAEVAGHLVATGVISAPTFFSEFVQGFNEHPSRLLSVVEVSTKRHVHPKIEGYLNFLSTMECCNFVVFGSPNDGTYHTVISDLDQSKLFIIDVVESEGLHLHLRPLEDRMIVIPEVFSIPMTRKRLGAKRGTSTSISPQAALPTPSTSPAFASSSPLPDVGGGASSEAQSLGSSAMAKSKLLSKDLLLVEDEATWSVVRSGGCKGSEMAEQRKARQQERTLESTRRQTQAMAAMKMKKGEGSSSGVKTGKGKKSDLDEAKITVRRLEPRPCHAFYLTRDGCRHLATCPFGHEYKLKPAEIQAVGILAKEMCCPMYKQGKCRTASEADCIYSHNCPRGKNCAFKEDCWFPDHNGTKITSARHVIKRGKNL